MAAFGRVIDTVRNSEYRKASKEHKEVYKGAKYLLLKNRRNVRRRSHRQQLKELLALNEVISTVMILKDKLSSSSSGAIVHAPRPPRRSISGVHWPDPSSRSLCAPLPTCCRDIATGSSTTVTTPSIGSVKNLV